MALVGKLGVEVVEMTTPTVFWRPSGMETMWPFLRRKSEE